MEEMTRKQPDVDKITKTHKRKAAAEPQIQSQIPVLDKGRAGSMYPITVLHRVWPEPSGHALNHFRVTRHPQFAHFSTWNDVSVNAFLLIIWWKHSHFKVFCLSLTGKRSPTQAMYASSTQAPIETKNPRVNLLVTKWQHVWLLALDRRRKLNDALDRLEEVI